MKKSLRGVVATAGVVAAVLAVAGPYNTIGIYQVSGTSSLPADGDSPFASCDISGFSGGELSYLNTEVSPWVAVNPTVLAR